MSSSSSAEFTHPLLLSARGRPCHTLYPHVMPHIHPSHPISTHHTPYPPITPHIHPLHPISTHHTPYPYAPPSHRCHDTAAVAQQHLDACGVRGALKFAPVPHNGAVLTPARQDRAWRCCGGVWGATRCHPSQGPSQGQSAAFGGEKGDFSLPSYPACTNFIES